MGFTRVSAYVETANVASIRVVQKLGMRFVGGGADGVPAWAEYARLHCHRRTANVAGRGDARRRPHSA